MDVFESGVHVGVVDRMIKKHDMQSLIDAFPSLKRRGSVWAIGYGADACARFKRSMKGMSHGEKCAAKFVLSVWNHFENEFNFQEAMGCWDPEHVAVVRAWMADPWWM